MSGDFFGTGFGGPTGSEGAVSYLNKICKQCIAYKNLYSEQVQ